MKLTAKNMKKLASKAKSFIIDEHLVNRYYYHCCLIIDEVIISLSKKGKMSMTFNLTKEAQAYNEFDYTYDIRQKVLFLLVTCYNDLGFRTSFFGDNLYITWE